MPICRSNVLKRFQPSQFRRMAAYAIRHEPSPQRRLDLERENRIVALENSQLSRGLQAADASVRLLEIRLREAQLHAMRAIELQLRIWSYWLKLASSGLPTQIVSTPRIVRISMNQVRENLQLITHANSERPTEVVSTFI